jgi:hypothetical protein
LVFGALQNGRIDMSENYAISRTRRKPRRVGVFCLFRRIEGDFRTIMVPQLSSWSQGGANRAATGIDAWCAASFFPNLPPRHPAASAIWGDVPQQGIVS